MKAGSKLCNEYCTSCDPNVPLPDPDGDGCPDVPVIDTDITGLEASADQTNESNITYPNAFHQVRFSDGRERLALEGELPPIHDCYETTHTLTVDARQVFFVQTPYGGGNADVGSILALRAEGVAMSLDLPDGDLPMPGDPPLEEGDGGVPQFTFFIYDHPEQSGQALGNSRILYTTQLVDCDPDKTKYLLEHVIDYYPYGKTLREFVFVRERFQTTYHERDRETGLDNRGARFYDGDVGRFLSADPLAAKYAGWSSYNYVLGNPIMFIDPYGWGAMSTIVEANEVGTQKEVDVSISFQKPQRIIICG